MDEAEGVPEGVGVAVSAAVPLGVPLAVRVAVNVVTVRVVGRQGRRAVTAAGTLVRPSRSAPQQATPPDNDRLHVWRSPAETATWFIAATAGGTVARGGLPQQVNLPPTDSAHACEKDAATASWPPAATAAGTVV